MMAQSPYANSAYVHSAFAQGGYQTPKLLTQLQERRVTESSGLAVGGLNSRIIWTHNDSGHGPFLYATDRQGRALAAVEVDGARAVDWEDIAVGPGADGKPALYIGDIGDNGRSRSHAVIYRIPEPAINFNETGQRERSAPAEAFPFVYPDGRHDAETLLVHPKTGDIYVVTKGESGQSGVYRFPMPLIADRIVTLQRVATITFSNPIRMRGRSLGKLATGGAFSRDGTRIAIRTYLEAFEWTLRPGQSVEDALKQRPRLINAPFLGQFESICYRADGRGLLTSAEGSPCLIWEIPAR
jgi:hypothetical protein